MVTSISSLGRNGVQDWLVQRLSAVIMLVWFIYMGYVVFTADNLTFIEWQGVFAPTWMRIFTLITMISLCAHAWIGMWTISTDYLTSTMLGGAATKVRLLFQLVCVVVLITYLLWCVQILWSI